MVPSPHAVPPPSNKEPYYIQEGSSAVSWVCLIGLVLMMIGFVSGMSPF